MLVAKVVPQTRLPRGLIFFDYLIPDELAGRIKIGALVKIPFRGQPVWGVVFEIEKESTVSPSKLKPITGLYQPNIFFPKQLLDLIIWLADELFVTPATILQAILPYIPQKVGPAGKFKLGAFAGDLKIKKEAVDVLLDALAKLNKLQKESGDAIVINYHFETEKKAIIYKLVEKSLKSRENIILISPHINSVSGWYDLLSPIVPGQISLLHSELTANELWQSWQAIMLGKARLAIGTRQAVFAPFEKVDQIIIDRSESDDLKQYDQNPRFDSRTVAIKRSQIENAKIYFFSQAPRIQDWTNLRHLTMDTGGEARSAQLIDLKNVQRSLSPLLSDKLIGKISETVNQKKKAFLLVNQRGLARSLMCQDCSQTMDCPNCKVPLAYHQDNLICQHCQYQQPIPMICQNCGGSRLKPLGHGIERLEAVLKKYFQKIKVERVDIARPFFDQTGQIIMGTPLFLNRYLDNLTDLGLASVVSLDNLLYLPDFNAAEKAMGILMNLAHFCGRKKIPFYIQTFKANNQTLRAAISDDYESFYQRELAERKALGYPPFARLVKIIIGRASLKETLAVAEGVRAILKKESANLVEVLGPMSVFKQHQKFKSYIVLKYLPERRSIIKKMLSKLGPEIVIDIDPVSLL